eukprot:2882816-Prymnesium_polylepis.1
MRRRGRSGPGAMRSVHDTPPRRRARRHARSLEAEVLDDRCHCAPRGRRPRRRRLARRAAR